MKQGAYIERYVDLTALLFKSPRTIAELRELTGLTADPVRRFVNALAAEGLVTGVEERPVPERSSPAVIRWTWVAK